MVNGNEWLVNVMSNSAAAQSVRTVTDEVSYPAQHCRGSCIRMHSRVIHKATRRSTKCAANSGAVYPPSFSIPFVAGEVS